MVERNRRGQAPAEAPKTETKKQEQMLIHDGNQNAVLALMCAQVSGHIGKISEEQAATIVENAVLIADTFADNHENPQW